MISLESCSGIHYQTIHITEDDTKYKDILKYIKNPPSKYPEFDPRENKYLHKMLYKIFVKTSFNMLSDGVKVNLDDDIDFNKNVLQLVFGFEYYCYHPNLNNLQKSKKYKFKNNVNLEIELQSLIIDNVKEKYSVLSFVPDELKTEEICRSAIIDGGCDMLYHIPYSMRTTEICKYIIGYMMNYNTVRSIFPILQLIPNEILADVIKSILRNKSLEVIPTKFKTPQICMEAVKINVRNLEHVPYKLRTEEICKIAFKQNVPKKLITGELCVNAVKGNPYIILNIPEEMITEELCMTAVEGNPYIILNIPEEMITEELCMTAVKENPGIIKIIPKEMITEEICKISAKHKDNLLKFVPDKFKTEEICRLATHNNRSNIFYVPYEMQYLFM
jgi:hypothetical protein